MTSKRKYIFENIICFIAMLFIVYEYALRSSLSLMISPLMKSFHANGFQIGLLGSFYYYSIVAMQLPAGILIDRYNVRYIVTIALAICTIGSFTFSISHQLLYAELSRFMIGLGSAFAFISLFYLIKQWLQRVWFETYIGLYNALAGFIYIGVSTIFASAFDIKPWREVMMWFVYIGIILTIFAFIIIRDRPQGVEVRQTNTFKNVLKGAGHLLTEWRIWCVTIISFLMFVPFTTLATLWLIDFFEDVHKVTTYRANFVAICFFAGFAVGGVVIGYIADRIDYRALLLIISNLLLTILLFIVIYVMSLDEIEFMVLYFFIGFFVGSFILTYYFAKEFVANENTATAFALISLGSLLSGLIFQPVIGYILDSYWDGTIINGAHIFSYHAFAMAFMLIPICTFLAAVFSFILLFSIKRYNK